MRFTRIFDKLLLGQLNIVNSWCLMNGHEKHENSQKQHRLFCGFLCFLWLKKSRYLSAVSIVLHNVQGDFRCA